MIQRKKSREKRANGRKVSTKMKKAVDDDFIMNDSQSDMSE